MLKCVQTHYVWYDFDMIWHERARVHFVVFFAMDYRRGRQGLIVKRVTLILYRFLRVKMGAPGLICYLPGRGGSRSIF